MLLPRRHEISRLSAFDELESFDLRAAAGAHLIGVGGGLLATAVALFAPRSYAPFSGFTCFLMSPAPWLYGTRPFRRRKTLEARLPPSAASPEAV